MITCMQPNQIKLNNTYKSEYEKTKRKCELGKNREKRELQKK